MALPRVQIGHWGRLGKQVVDAFNRRSNLPDYELPKAKVETPKALTRPLPTDPCNMQFSAWRLAHAVKKADCIRSEAAPFLWVGQVLHYLSSANRSQGRSRADGADSLESARGAAVLDGGTLYGSVFLDGFLMSELRVRRVGEPLPEIKWTEVEL
jgi:hypothetical protein